MENKIRLSDLYQGRIVFPTSTLFQQYHFDEFNKTVAFFNDGMSAKNFIAPTGNNTAWTNSAYTQIPMAALTIFNNRGYPRINPYNYNLEWWVDNALYSYMLPDYTNAINQGTVAQNASATP